MKKLLITAFAAFSLQCFSQDGYEILIYETNVDHFDVYGNDDYEKHNRSNNDITEYLIPEGVVKDKAEPIGSDNFEAKNMFDGNMKTCWLTAWDGKNEVIEIVIDIEENAEVPSAEIRSIYFANGWRKDMQTWKNYSRLKKVSMSINEKPYAEITFENTYKMQGIDIDKLKIEKSRRYRIRLRVLELYKGDKFDQLAISDIQLNGKIKK